MHLVLRLCGGARKKITPIRSSGGKAPKTIRIGNSFEFLNLQITTNTLPFVAVYEPLQDCSKGGFIKECHCKTSGCPHKLNFITINHGCRKFNVHDEIVDYIKFPGCKKDATLSNTAFVNCTYIARFKTEKGKLFV